MATKEYEHIIKGKFFENKDYSFGDNFIIFKSLMNLNFKDMQLFKSCTGVSYCFCNSDLSNSSTEI